MRIWENGNRKIVYDMEILHYEGDCSFQLYEDERYVMSVVILEETFTNSRKRKRVVGFFDSFLEHGIENMIISDIYNSFVDIQSIAGNIIVYLKNGMKYEYSIVPNKYGCGECEKLFFEINGKEYGAKLLNRDITYHELSTLTTDNVLDYIDVVYILNRVRLSYDSYIMDYDMKIPTYPDVIECIWKVENLKKTDYFNTGHLFKLTDDTKKELAKRKFLTGEVPMLLAVDSKGYGVFDGISYIVTK